MHPFPVHFSAREPLWSAANTHGNFTTSCARIRDPTTGNHVGFSSSDNANALNCPGDFRIYERAWLLSQCYSRQRSGNGRLIASVTIYANSSRRPFSLVPGFVERDLDDVAQERAVTTRDNVESLLCNLTRTSSDI